MKSLEEIKLFISEGEFVRVRQEIKKWLKKNKTTYRDRITLSEMYTWLGDDQSSWKITGPLLTLKEMETANDDQMALQLRQAYLLGMLGAKYVSDRLYAFASKRLGPKNLEKYYPQYYQNRGHLAISQYLPENALEYFQKALEFYPQNDYRYFFISLGICDAYAMLGRFAEAKLILERFRLDSKELLAIHNQVYGEILNYMGESKESLSKLNKAKNSFSPDNQSKDYAYLLKHMGLNLCWSGEIDQGISFLLTAKKLLLHETGTPTSLMEVLFWIELYQKEALTLRERILTRCFPHYSIYADRLGRQGPLSLDKICPWVPVVEERVLFWEVDGNDILKKQNYELPHRIKTTTVDFVSNSFFDGQARTPLTELEGRILLSLFGASIRRMHLYHLTDKLYQHEFVSWESGLDRIKKLLKTLSKKVDGIKIVQNTVIWNYPREYHFVLKSNLEIGSPVEALAIVLKRMPLPQEVEETFGINRRTAQRWIKEYSELC
ncbi:MAG: hypothetical protein Fur0010_17100 [Bdellovibrio sp.]